MKKYTPGSGLRAKFFATGFAVLLVTSAFALAILWYVLRQVTNELGVAYAEKSALASSAVLGKPLERIIFEARLMADSPAIREWVRDESNEHKRADAFAELESCRQRFSGNTWFLVVNSSLHYYFDDKDHRYSPSLLAYTLDPDKEDHQWYFATLRSVADYAPNVDYDLQLDLCKVWINVVIRDSGGAPIGMAGTGIDLSEFLHDTVDQEERGVTTLVLDRRTAIQAAKDRSLIDQHSLVKASADLSKIDRLIDDPAELETMRAAFDRLKKGSSAETFSVTMKGKPCIAGAAYVATLDWYVLTVLEVDQVLGKPLYVPLMLLGAGALVLLFAVTKFTVDRVVIRPVVEVEAAVRRIAEGDYEADLSTARKDEIGVLAQAFQTMTEKIRENTALLEHRVAERTLQLTSANAQLKRHMEQLEHALANVRRLEGILPICASCKKVRDDQGYWTQVEAYVSERSGAEFSHGICPECAAKHYPMFQRKPDPGAGI